MSGAEGKEMTANTAVKTAPFGRSDGAKARRLLP
jgi:hypothetical protein